ncbi:SRPBCC family protein [Parapedobacter tibetensis]|uniref:SRPBCC family protein n=1 Tax=Parapedobacter tibetensis TaxID=2972951 RepID=UPI00214D6023|nr:SRPBCC domain-containing protein [Parapedobacter tibetensis]
MEKMQFKKDINAPVAKVYDTMLGQETFKQWTAVFNPSSESDMEGSWDKGSKILFVGTNDEGKREGMVGRIKENILHRFVSIEYTGIIDGDKEITEGPAAEGWAGTFENYTFEEHDGATTVTVDIDVNDEMFEYFKVTYPKALDKLKGICEV